MTNREFYVAVSNSTINDEVIAKANELIASMDSRNAARAAKPSKAQLENAPIKEALFSYLSNNDGQFTETQLGEALSITHNKAGSLARQLVAEGKAVSAEIKLPKVGKRKVYSIKVD